MIDSVRTSFFFLLLIYIHGNVYFVNGQVPSNVSSRLETIRAQANLPAVLGIAVRNGTIVAQGVAGVRRQGSSTAMLVNDIINIGGVTQWMTAALAARLIQTGVISWTTTVSDCFKDFTNIHPDYQNVTLEQFLAHQVGVQDSFTFEANYRTKMVSTNQSIRQRRRWAAERVLTDFGEQDFSFAHISQLGYTVAAAMMEAKTNQDWEVLIQEHLFKPLNMTGAKIGISHDNVLPPKSPVGHIFSGGKPIPNSGPVPNTRWFYNDQAVYGPSTFVACTSQDLIKFFRTQVYNEAMHYWTNENYMKMITPYRDTMFVGMGVLILDHGDDALAQTIIATGQSFGQNLFAVIIPAKNSSVLAYTNSFSTNSESQMILQDIISELTDGYLVHNE